MSTNLRYVGLDVHAETSAKKRSGVRSGRGPSPTAAPTLRAATGSAAATRSALPREPLTAR